MNPTTSTPMAGGIGTNTPIIQKKNFYVTEVENGYTVACRNTTDYLEKINIATTKEDVLKIISDYLA